MNNTQYNALLAEMISSFESPLTKDFMLDAMVRRWRLRIRREFSMGHLTFEEYDDLLGYLNQYGFSD